MSSLMNANGLLDLIATGAHAGGGKVLMADGSVRFLTTLPEITTSVKHAHPGGANMIVIGESTRTGWSPMPNFVATGIIAILIGLLLPAVQLIRDAAQRRSMKLDPNTLASLKSMLQPGGKIYVIDTDGKLLPYIE